ncbi:MAG: ABC transporter permease [Blastocatellia bacterium]|nr:ABC transporter permease [Blastocatellia bacterium]
MQTLVQDIRYGIRLLLKNPGFSSIAVITLALGIGANTAIFSVVNGVLLRPLAYREPARIVTLLHEGERPISPANFLDLRANSRSFEQMAAAESWGGALTGTDRPEQISGLRMGEGLFDMLGVPSLLGRTLQPDDYAPGRDRVLVLGHKLWQRVFGGDADIIGRQVRLNGESYTVVGVMPPQFQFPPFWSTRAEMWTPLDLASRGTNRRLNSLRAFGRLKPGATLAQAQTEMETLSRQLAAAYPEANADLNIRVDLLNEKVVGNVRPALLILSVMVGIVLLIACANIACLLLARAAARQREIAVRGAMGASRRRILRQMLTESLLLSLCGAAGGLLLAVWGVNWLTALLGGNSSGFNVRLPRLSEVQLDPAALVFTLSVSLLTGLVFGLAPALIASKPDLNQLLKEGGRGAIGRRGRLREMLVVAELALSVMLLIGAGLLMKSFLKLQAVDPGFDQRNLLTATISLAGASQYVGPARETFYRQLMAKIRSVPGIESASAINHLPLAGDTWGTDIVIEGRPLPPAGQDINAAFRVSRPDYFRTMGIPLRAGRDFTAQDKPGAVIVNETLARRYWPSEEAVGKRLTLDNPRDASQPVQWLTVVGVTADVKQQSWTSAPANEIYLPFNESGVFYSGTAPQFASMSLVARTSVDPSSLIVALQEAVRGLDRNLPVSRVMTMEQIVADALWQPRFNLQLVALFAGLALTLASVGLYGVMAYSVAQRSHEVGLRMAMGAQQRDVLRLVVGQGMKLALVGVALGLLASAALTRAMTTLLYLVSATDPLTFLSIAALLLAIAFLACYLPARRASHVDPMAALRGD